MWDGMVDPFAPTASERMFEAQAKIDSFYTSTVKKEPDAFDYAMQQQAARRREEVYSMGLFERFMMWLLNKVALFFHRPPSLEDTLADMVIVMLDQKPEGWRFTGDQAKFDDMHVIVNFPSWKKIRFQMRTMDHKTFYPDIKPSRNKRRELYSEVLRARDIKILTSVTAEVKKQVFMITDQRVAS